MNLENYIILDVETTTLNYGDPYNRHNWMVCAGFRNVGTGEVDILFNPNYEEPNYWSFNPEIDRDSVFIGTNLKFDLAWVNNYGFYPTKVFDIQLAFYMLRHQRVPYPSLNQMAEYYGLPGKLSHIEENYWSKGIDTPSIPKNELREYLERDLELTEQVFLKIMEELQQPKNKNLFKLIQIHNMDLLVLQQMEYDGIPFDLEGAAKYHELIKDQLSEKLNKLDEFFPQVPKGTINWNSTDHISCVLFGGTFVTERRVPVGTYKSGAKVGSPRFKIETDVHTFNRLVNPRKEWALQKDGYYSAREQILRQIKHPIAQSLLDYAETVKLSEYFEKIPALFKSKNWDVPWIHGKFNQCVTRTGRLSSSDPNLQNQHPEIQQFFVANPPYMFSLENVFVGVDAKALEWYSVVWLAQDPVGMEEIINGLDQHSLNQETFGLPSRHIAKIFVFRLIYGGSEYSYAKDPDFMDVSKDINFWREVIEKFYDKYKGIARLHKRWMDEVQTNGHHTMPTGRTYAHEPIPGKYEWPRTQIINYPVQGLGADLMAIIRVLADRYLREQEILAYASSTVHDSIYYRTHADECSWVHKAYTKAFEEAPKAFEKAFGIPFNLPLRCEITVGPNLGDMKEYKL